MLIALKTWLSGKTAFVAAFASALPAALVLPADDVTVAESGSVFLWRYGLTVGVMIIGFLLAKLYSDMKTESAAHAKAIADVATKLAAASTQQTAMLTALQGMNGDGGFVRDISDFRTQLQIIAAEHAVVKNNIAAIQSRHQPHQ